MIMLASLVVACGGPSAKVGGSQAEDTATIVASGDLPAGKNVLADVLEMNSAKYARPPTKFRKGHVKAKKPAKLKQTKVGFEIRFPSGAPITTPAVYDDKVFVSGGFKSKEYYAFNATTGKPVWSLALDDDGPSTGACSDGTCWLGDPLTSSPTIENGRVFTSYPAAGVSGDKPRPPGATHAIIALDLQSGEILWQQWLDSDVMSAPVATDDFVYINTFAGTLMKLEQKTGKIRYAVKARATSAPVVNFAADGRETMFYTRRGEEDEDDPEEMIIRADHNDPKTTFTAKRKKAKYLDKKVQAKSTTAATEAADDAANGFSGGAPEAANARAAYANVGKSSVSGMQAFQGSRILHLGSQNVNTMGDEVVATSAETGKELWSYKLSGELERSGGFLGTAPLAAGDSVILATLKGKVVRLDPKSGKVMKSYSVGSAVRSQPVVAGGWIYVGTQDGRLVAINTKDRSLTGWPMWGGNAARTGIQLKK
jgi:outer membrane protein assembly factor BamB